MEPRVAGTTHPSFGRLGPVRCYNSPNGSAGLAPGAPVLDLTHVHFRGIPAGRSQAAVRLAGQIAAYDDGASAVSVAGPPAGLPARVLALAGLSPSAYRSAPLERRVNACLRALKADTEVAARRQLDAAPELLPLALSTLLIGVSGFFRDAAVFDALRTVVVPALHATPGSLRVWSVGCSTGAELYSVAILLAEAGVLDRAELLGTDCRRDALDAARDGVFAAGDLQGVGDDVRARYFERVPHGWRLAGALRARTAWRAGDATRDVADGPWHLVLCRNLVIYLQPAAAEPLFVALAARLAPGGFLVVGKAERPPASSRLATIDRCVYRRAHA
jgi:chemotaxis protein methyltransferase CheR